MSFRDRLQQRKWRLIVSIVSPAILGVSLIFAVLLFTILFTSTTLASALSLLPYMIVFSFLFIGIQSVIAALIIEFIVRPRATQRLHIVIAYTILGAVAGWTLWEPGYIVIGLLVGCILGRIVSIGFPSTTGDDTR